MCSWYASWQTVARVFAIVLDVEIFQVHEIIEKCKNHDPPAGGGEPRRLAGASRLVFGVLVQLSARKNQPKATEAANTIIMIKSIFICG
jgi:hypothetical protein